MSYGIPIPIVHANKLIVMENKGITHLYYGITEDSIRLHLAALKSIEEYIHEHKLGDGELSYDFRVETRIEERRWFCYKMDTFLDSAYESAWLNVYEDRSVTPFKSAIKGNKGSYERVYWYQQKNK